MWYAYIHFCISQPQKMMFTEQFRYSGIVSPQIIDDMEQKMVSLKELLIKMQQGGIIKENDPDIILAQFKGPIHEIVKLSLHKNITLNEDILEKCYQMAWNSIKQ